MLRCPRPLASIGSAWTQGPQLLLATQPHLPVQSNYLTPTDPGQVVQSGCLPLKQTWERNSGTPCAVSLWALPCPLAEKRNRWRWSDSPRGLRATITGAVSLDALNGHCSGMDFSSLTMPVQASVLPDRLPQPQDPSQCTRKSSGAQTWHLPASHDLWKASLLEQLSPTNGQKPVHCEQGKCLSEDLPSGERLSSISKSTRNRSVCGNRPVRTGLFHHRDFCSGGAGSPLNPRSAQIRRLHLALAGSVLSAENEARCRRVLRPNMAVYERERAKPQARQGQRGWAAVLVSLCSVQGEPAFLFTLRSSTLKGRHKGDVSFAGGKQDPSDRDVVDTALREACEELGVSVATGSVWGTLKPLRDMSGMLIAPVLANLGPLEALSFRPNPGEVEEVFTVSLAHLCCPRNRGYTNYRVGERYGYTTPVFLNTKHRVWGLTAVALDHALKIVVPPQRSDAA